MCILCVIQKWSRRVATMLPWLVLPLIGLWALSQLLPPAFRFEITSPRLACVLMLVVILFWYEILMPQLSAWRVRRNARLRERKRFEAIELQKLRKTATRRCRNCLTPYRDQNPGGGRFMCSYCGHVSKRPVLDVSLPPGMGTADTGTIKDLVGKGGKVLNGKAWNDYGWMSNQDWLENGNLIGGSVAGKSSYWRKNGSAIFGGDEPCLAEKSYSGVLLFLCKLLTSFLMSIRWLWRKIFRVSSSGENSSADADHQGLLAKRSESGPNGHESRGEKARRKAEEKRQARLEREHLEEEERKQREEVARLVEERRRLRDEKMEAEKDRNKISALAREKESKREAEKKRPERRKEKDKGSSKSNSDAEELEKKACKDTERKRDSEKKNDIDRREQKSGTKSISTYGLNGGNAGTRYLDRMRGTLLSSSRAFSGGSFFGRGASTSNTTTTTTTKENKFSSSSDHVNDAVHRRDLYPPERITGKASISGDDKSINRPVLSEPQPRTAPKKSWQQLFTRSSSPPPSSNINVISRPNSKSQSEVQSVQLQGQSSIQSFDNAISFGLPSPFSAPVYANGSTSGSLGFSPIIEPVFPRIGEGPHDFTPEEVFEDPCYVPDPISLLGPVSESLDNFHRDVGTVFGTDLGLEGPHVMKNVYLSPEVHKPSPIESPLSRLRMADEKLNNSNRSSGSSKVQDMHTLPGASEKGTWQMWNSSPLGQDGLCLGGGPASLFLHQELNRSNMEELLHLSTQKSMTPLFTIDDSVLSGTHSPRKVFTGNSQNGGPFSSVTNSGDPHPWLPNASFPPLAVSENHLTLKHQEECNENDMNYGSLHGSTSNYSSEVSPANCWAKQEQAIPLSAEDVGKSSVLRPPIGDLFPNSDVQSLWSI